jgi:hypothetical protein
MFSEGGTNLYVGRTRSIRARYGQHTRLSSGHNSASFAFKLARQMTGYIKAEYKAGEMLLALERRIRGGLPAVARTH